MKTPPLYYLKVFEVVSRIPFGRISTYGAIADYLGLGSARMVGWALNKCMSYGNIPAHRVVNRKGELSGRNHFPSPSMMEELLENEGVKVENNKVADFSTLFWDPADEIA